MASVAEFDHRNTGLLVVGSPTLAQWKSEGETLLTVQRSLGWWVADWLAIGEARFGEDMCLQAISEKWSPGYLANCKWVGSRFIPSRRRESLTFSHHQDLASYTQEEQEEWLDRCEAEGWSRAELRRELRIAKGEGMEEEWQIVRESELRCVCGRKYRFELAED